MCPTRSQHDTDPRSLRRTIDRRSGFDRRSGVDRRQVDLPVEVDRRKKDRRSGIDRRQCPLA